MFIAPPCVRFRGHFLGLSIENLFKYFFCSIFNILQIPTEGISYIILCQGLGFPIFDKLEAQLAKAVMSFYLQQRALSLAVDKFTLHFNGYNLSRVYSNALYVKYF